MTTPTQTIQVSTKTPDRHARERSTIGIYLSAMTRPKDEDDQLVVVDLIDNSVVTRSHSPFASTSDQLNRLRRSRVLCQEIDCGL